MHNFASLSVDKNCIDGSLASTRFKTDIDHILGVWIPVGNLLLD
ncbi:hypothetical protein yberc0001_32240 [Yersinia bercovieri ATCC 43970]|uniref:Uncharacterized protein n=1 Tax=Yersinia bercovieri ATCC 43970 TaxID=349968 RepID=A0ABM9Y143_YERBE|nr:hypothetical protein yberc0001_32240 [Yersinia bercovieri ATCC 43970]